MVEVQNHASLLVQLSNVLLIQNGNHHYDLSSCAEKHGTQQEGFQMSYYCLQ